MNVKLDLSPANGLEHFDVTALHAPVTYAGTASASHEAMQNVGTFYGAGPFDSNEEAVERFNADFAAFIESVLPHSPRLYWRRRPQTVQAMNFERDCIQWKVVCRVTAYAAPVAAPRVSLSNIEATSLPIAMAITEECLNAAPVDTSLAESEAARVAAAEKAFVESEPTLAGLAAQAGTPAVTQAEADAALGIDNGGVSDGE